MILLVTNSPEQRGLAYYYFLALRDNIGIDSVELLSSQTKDYLSNEPIYKKVARRLKEKYFNNYSRWQTNRIIASLSKDSTTHILLFNSAGLLAEDIQKLSTLQNIKLYQYLSDSPSGMNTDKFSSCIPTLKYFDKVFVYARSLVPVIYQYGAKEVIYLPFGFCRYTHLKDHPSQSEIHQGIYYFGTWGPLIEESLKPLAKFELQIEGNSWKRSKYPYLRSAAQHGTIKEGGMAEKAAQATIVINFIRAQHGCFNSMKTFELAAAGACVITNRTEEQLDFFEDMKEAVYFDSQQEMVEKIEQLLNNEDLQKVIRTNAYVKVQNHSYHERANELLRQITK
ncbi:MAG: spore maturation protein CgeB [Cyclobacteriaceae bacterium]